MLARRIALAGGGAGQRGEQFGAEQREITLHPAFAPDQYVIGGGKAVGREQPAQQFTKPPLHPVADNGVADSFGDGDPEAHLLGLIGPGEQHEPGTRDAQSPVGSKEISAPR